MIDSIVSATISMFAAFAVSIVFYESIKLIESIIKKTKGKNNGNTVLYNIRSTDSGDRCNDLELIPYNKNEWLLWLMQ